MTLPRLEPTARIGDQVFDVIRAAIMNGALAGGQPLRIRDLAEELGTSVMPVREAIRRLEELALVETRPNRSAIVRTFTPLELLNVYEVRRTVEVDAARLGVERITDEDVEHLAAAHGTLVTGAEGHDVVAYIEADERFLSIIYRAAGNPVLLEMIQLLWQRSRSYKMVGAGPGAQAEDPEVLLTFQRGLMEAARSRDPRRAGELTARSLDAAISRIREALPAR